MLSHYPVACCTTASISKNLPSRRNISVDDDSDPPLLPVMTLHLLRIYFPLHHRNTPPPRMTVATVADAAAYIERIISPSTRLTM